MNQVIKKQEAQKNIRANIKRMMQARGFTVRSLAAESENNHMTVQRLTQENVALPSVDCLLRIASVLGVSVEELFSKPSLKRKMKKVS